MSSGATPRAVAARCIAAVMGGSTLERALAEHSGACIERDHALLRELCYGTLRAYPRLEAILAQLLSRPMKSRDRELKALALLGLYQLSEMRTPDHAAVSATVDATAAINRKSARGLINAVLRRFLRERDALHEKLSPDARAAMPAWLWALIGRNWPAQRDAIAAAANSRPPLTLRVNRQRGTRENYLSLLAEEAIEASAGELCADAITLFDGRDVSELPGFAEGTVSVQDEAAQLAATLLAPIAGERILDACAAPGGKSCHLLELEPSIDLVCCDNSRERLKRVSGNLERLGQSAQLCCGDLRTPPDELTAAPLFDAILVDVPCSATGVIRRHPDIKLLRRETDIDGFCEQQAAILDGCWALLNPGGRLLYVTCSILGAENSDIIAAFTSRTINAREVTLAVPHAQTCTHGLQLLPGTKGADGLYFALIEKAADSANGSNPG